MNQSKEHKKARRPGQPTKYKKEYCQKLIEFAKSGLTTVNMWGEHLDVHIDTLYEWAKVHKEFSESLRRARQIQKTNFDRFYMGAMTGKIKGTHALLIKYFATAQVGWKEETEFLDQQETTVEFQYE